MFDCFMMNNELDVVDVRLNTLASTVEKFIIVESAFTHTGKPKLLHFANSKHRFEKFSSQIIYLEYPYNPKQTDPWYHENNQRNFILEALKTSRPEDGLIFISDADEIPAPAALLEARDLSLKTGYPVGIKMDDCMYYMNYVGDKPMKGPYIINPDTAEKFHSVWTYNGKPYPGDPSAIRWHVGSYNAANINDFQFVNGGWHFSSLGGIELLKQKIESCAHWQFDTDKVKTDEYLRNCIINGTAYYEDVAKFLETPRKYTKRSIDFLPEYVQSNLTKFKKYILE